MVWPIMVSNLIVWELAHMLGAPGMQVKLLVASAFSNATYYQPFGWLTHLIFGAYHCCLALIQGTALWAVPITFEVTLWTRKS
jgi:hypothetical protein